MPFALTIGVPYDLFWHLTPNKLRAFYMSYKQKRKIDDEKMWLMGQYIMLALDATVCNNSFWKGQNGTPSNYPKEPLMQNIEQQNKENAPILTEEEKRRQTEQLFMRLKIMGANHKLNKKDNKDK